MASGRIRRMAHPIASLKLPFPNKNTRFAPPDRPFWKQNLTKGTFLLPDPLRDAPDWTYLDGRPSPLNETQLTLKIKQVELAKAVVQGLKEIREAEAEHAEFEKKRQTEQEAAVKLKPRPKGSMHQSARPA